MIKYLIVILTILIPCIALAGEAMFQGAVNPYQTMGQGAVQLETLVAAAPAPPAAEKAVPRVQGFIIGKTKIKYVR